MIADSNREDAYVTLKMCERNSGPGEREKGIYDHLRSIKSSHIGSTLVRRALDDFQLRSADNEHSYQCLVHPPLGMGLHELMNRAKGKHLPAELVKPAVLQVLFALDFLHTEAGVVHAGMVWTMNNPDRFRRGREIQSQSTKGRRRSGNLLISKTRDPEDTRPSCAS
ncbi:Serine protein kinase [Penicillium longicatenatum]|nr:Serine protein kinase [Penicillium longicatenatum]